jgi:hypothetical protein
MLRHKAVRFGERNLVDIIEDGVFPERLHQVVEEPASRALIVGATIGQKDLVHHACAFQVWSANAKSHMATRWPPEGG